MSGKLFRVRVTLIDGDKRAVTTVDAPIADPLDRVLERVARRTRNAAEDLLDDAGLLPEAHSLGNAMRDDDGA